ncbi:MAG: FAD-dependent oxidoreductase, partial [Phycisphaerae bacterium]|nr:FAD-dependent oxidoreductase [Phycisphaerae bacterium]
MLFLIVFFAFAGSAKADGSFDIVIYGATPSGITAAVSAARAGSRVALIEPSYLIGGMMSGGLTKTDIGRTEAIGGLAREFYNRVHDYYVKTYGAESQQAFDCNGGYYFESKLALDLFGQMLADAHVTVVTKQLLQSVDVEHHQIISIRTSNTADQSSNTYAGKMFIDASYEGDLLAASHVMYRVGREARSEFNESLAGMTEGPEQYRGTGDQRVMAFNIRGGITDRPDLRLPFPKPTHYDADASAGYIKTVLSHHYHTLHELFPSANKWGNINGHFDSNSGDSPGINFAYADADAEARQRIAQRVTDHWLSIWWGLQNDPALPEEFRKDALNWGVPKDEYMESNHVTPQIYVRECRRMLGQYFLTQRDLVSDRFKSDAICMGNYGFDTHVVQLALADDGMLREGEISGSTDLYDIPYRCLLPYGVDNLLVTVCVSASHVAYCSLRME